MSDKKEKLSALVDGELDAAVSDWLLDQLQTDEELRASWERLHLIGHAIRGEPVHAGYCGIAERVRERLSEEPTVLVPGAMKGNRPASWLTPIVSTALAASLALVAVFALRPYLSNRQCPVRRLPSRLVPHQSVMYEARETIGT
jgi:negative regulator of sigma E activity